MESGGDGRGKEREREVWGKGKEKGRGVWGTVNYRAGQGALFKRWSSSDCLYASAALLCRSLVYPARFHSRFTVIVGKRKWKQWTVVWLP